MLEINGTLINYYFHCKRQCYLAGNRINMEDQSELVKIGKALHESKVKTEKDELLIDNIRIDSLRGGYLIERKKSAADAEAGRWQILFYLKKLREKGLFIKGKLEFFEKKKGIKTECIELTEDLEKKLIKVEKEILNLILSGPIPEPINEPKCKKCAFFDYCSL